MDGAAQVRVGGDISGDVARADTEGGLAAGVRGAHHRVATGGENRGDTVVLHQRLGGIHRGLFDPLHTALGRTGRDGRVTHDASGLARARLGAGVEGEDDRVAGLQGDERLEDRGGSGVGDRSHRTDHTDRLGYFSDTGQFVTVDHAHGAQVTHRVGDVLAGEDVLDGLVFEQPSAGLFDRQPGQLSVRAERRKGRLLDDVVDLLLVVRLELQERLLGVLYEFVHLVHDLHGQPPSSRASLTSLFDPMTDRSSIRERPILREEGPGTPRKRSQPLT